MIGNTNEPGDNVEEPDTASDEALDEDNVGDLSVEINVEELVAKVEKGDAEETAKKAAIRRRLEEIREQKDSELDSTFNFNLDDDDL